MNRFTATISGFAIALGMAVPAPAQADSDDLAKWIAGAAALAIIAKAIDDRNDRKKAAASAHRRSVEQYSTYDNRRIIDGTIRPYHKNRDTKIKAARNKPLPRTCLRVIETNRGERLGYQSRCLERNYRYADRLPRSCETIVRTNGRFQSIYGARCLRRDGWKVARR
ncbi:MAG: hypothetical protein OXQ92_16550 [Boseongicola sp.]|nr:hypothetical protein [Boseongicola sp.]MDD9978794.1 hypothetical protein [Boseongicola sp.]